MSKMAAMPLSRQNIRVIANVVREIANSGTMFNVLQFLEIKLLDIDPQFELHIVEDSEIEGCYAKACPDKHLIIISASVYDGACNNNGRHRFTICHELGHYLLHGAETTYFPRLGRELRAYEDPEWQANTFAGELLVPEDIAKNFSADEIVKMCGVSRQVALIQKEQVSKQKNRATKRLESLVTIA